MATRGIVDHTSYYYNNGKQIALPSDPNIFAVRFVPGRKVDDAKLSVSARRFLTEDSEPVGFIPNYGLQIYRAKLDSLVSGVGASVERAMKLIGDEEPIRFATQAVHRMDGDENVSFVTPRFVVAFKRDVTQNQIDQLNTRCNVRVVERLGYVSNGFLCEAPAAGGDTGPIALSNTYYETGLCDFAHPDFVERRQWRSSVSEMEVSADVANEFVTARDGDYLSRQWHLTLAKVTDAWGITRGNAAITIAVLDDGVDIAHPEFVGKLGPQYDFESNIADASPKSADDKHGTACAGVAAAKGVKSFGAAPACRLMPVRTPTMLGVAAEANMFNWVSDHGADVISCSWGPPDNAGPFSLVDNVRAAIHYCITSGRSGKGIPIFFAGGNGSESISNDGYASNPDIMAIAASTERDTHAPYSDFGPEVFICAPSSGDTSVGDRKIFTIDRRGAAGYNSGNVTAGDAAGDYTSKFGGTSSAAPLVAGIAALVLSVDPTLARDQVKEILKTTTEKIGGAGLYDSTGHHPQFGFGRINAFAAVDRAQGSVNGMVTGSGPSIVGPKSASAAAAPTFAVNLGSRRVYAVELATSRALFDGSNASRRTASNYYGSWVAGMSTESTWRPPMNIWSAMAADVLVYYRGHFADDGSWANYFVSANSADASSITIEAAVAGGGTTSGGAGPSLAAPNSAAANAPPTFRASLAGRRFFAVELATTPDLMDAVNASRRTSSNYYSSWTEGLTSTSMYTPPAAIWSSLAAAERVYYRGHFADDTQWGNYGVFPATGSLPSIQTMLQGGSVNGSSVAPVANELTYPSGAVFRAVTNPQDGIDYSDPVANGVIPLIEVRGHENQKLSDNFSVNELMARGARYARIAPQLVKALQSVRTRLAKPLIVESGYRYAALNSAVLGDPRGEHLTGRAAVIRCDSASITPLDVAKVALASIADEIGIGLGPSSVHIEVAGAFSTWVYANAAMTDEQFASLARSLHTTRSTRLDEPRSELTARSKPTIDAAEILDRSDPPPAFLINPGGNQFFAVEVATHWHLLDSGARAERTDDNFFGTWADPQTGLIEAIPGQGVVFNLPSEVWKRLGKGPALYYRVLSVSKRSSQWLNLSLSITDNQVAEAPRIRLVDRRQAHNDLGPTGLARVLGSHGQDDHLWNR